MLKLPIIVIFSLFLTACITSEQPFYQNFEAVSPLPSKSGLSDRKALAGLRVLKKNSAEYSIVISDKSFPAIFIRFDAEPSHFIVQIDMAKDGYQYELVKVEQGRILLYEVSTAKLIKKYDLTGLKEFGGVVGFRAASRADIEDLFKAVLQEKPSVTAYRVYNLENSIEKVSFDLVLDEIQVREARKKAKKKRKNVSKNTASAFQTDLWKNKWNAASYDLRRKVTALAPIDGKLQITDNTNITRLRLPWYNDTYLIRVMGSWTPKNLIIYYLQNGNGDLVRLNGKSSPIHAFNAKQKPLLNDQTVKGYLWFFGFFVRGDDGPFLLIETSNDTFIPKGTSTTDTATKTALNSKPKPIICKKSSGKYSYRCTGIIMYSNAIFGAEFGLQASGMMEMLNDEPIAADLSLKISAPISVGELGKAKVSNISPVSPVEKTMRNSSVPTNQRSNLKSALEGQAIKLNRTNTPFFSGLAAILIKRCSVPRDYKDRADLVKFTLSGLTGFMFGSDYSNPNLGTAIGSQMSNIALIAVGNKVGREIPCGALAENVADVIVKALRAGTRSASGGVSNFVRSCSRTFDKRRCNCLASTGRTVIPDIYSRYYDRGIFKQIISRNPLLGLQISLMCGIVRY